MRQFSLGIIGVAVLFLPTEIENMCLGHHNIIIPEEQEPAPQDSLHVEITWYTSSPHETDSTPFITADGSRVKHGIIAISRDLYGSHFDYGDSVYIDDMGWFEVRDLMHRRWTKAVDIWCDDRAKAIKNGRQKRNIYWNYLHSVQ